MIYLCEEVCNFDLVRIEIEKVVEKIKDKFRWRIQLRGNILIGLLARGELTPLLPLP